MSRTDKDRPYRVRVRDSTLLRYEDHDHLDGKCNLDEWIADVNAPTYKFGQCDLMLLNEPWFNSPTHEDIRNGWYSPVRMRDRDDAIRMVKEYNTTGEVDDERWLPRHHRNNCFQGGWWD